MILGAPWDLTLQLTARCNQCCRYCQVEPVADQPLDTWRALLAEAAGIGVFRIGFTGGEPLIFPDWPVLIEDCVRLRMRFRLNTNATLLTEESVRCLKESKRCDVVSVSLDGGLELHDALRGKGSWRRTLRGLELLREQQLPTVLHMTLCREHLGRVEESFYQMFVANSLPSVRVGIELNASGLPAMDYDEYDALLSELDEVQKKYVDHLLDSGALHTWRRLRNTADCVEQNGVFHSCGAGRRSLYIHTDGRISACMSHSAILGRVGSDRLVDIWRKSEVLNELRSLSGKFLTEITLCSNCEFRNFCSGSCPASGFGCIKKHREMSIV